MLKQFLVVAHNDFEILNQLEMGEAKVFVAFKIRIVLQLDDAREEVS